jgi:hypothetical protein
VSDGEHLAAGILPERLEQAPLAVHALDQRVWSSLHAVRCTRPVAVTIGRLWRTSGEDPVNEQETTPDAALHFRVQAQQT